MPPKPTPRATPSRRMGVASSSASHGRTRGSAICCRPRMRRMVGWDGILSGDVQALVSLLFVIVLIECPRGCVCNNRIHIFLIAACYFLCRAVAPTGAPTGAPVATAPDFSDCAVPPYDVSANYGAGAIVRVDGDVYRCKSIPFSLWCNNPGYMPGTTHSGDAWDLDTSLAC